MQRMARRWSVVVALLALTAMANADPQTTPPIASPTPTPSATGNPASMEGTLEAPSPDDPRPGRFRIGPIYLTPVLRVGTFGLDTNVFYTATDRQADVSGSGGPGLIVVLPFSRRARLISEGDLTYLYFVRTASERKLMGNARSALELNGARTFASIGGRFDDTYARPSTEVDRRVAERITSAEVQLRRELSARTRFSAVSTFSRQEVDAGTDFLGANLSETLNRDSISVTGGFDYALTPKTRLVAEGTYEKDQFHQDPGRDAARPLADIGIRTESSALISGQALGGVRWFLPVTGSSANRQYGAYANIDTTWHVTASTSLSGGYRRDVDYTALQVVSGAPTLRTEIASAGFRQEFRHRVEFNIEGRRTHTRTSGAVRLVLDSGQTIETVRDDVTYEATAELGYKVASRLWAGGRAGYGQRQSTIADFGVQGLIVGAKITFTP
jgi:Putative beta-barrel porin 2